MFLKMYFINLEIRSIIKYTQTALLTPFSYSFSFSNFNIKLDKVIMLSYSGEVDRSVRLEGVRYISHGTSKAVVAYGG